MAADFGLAAQSLAVLCAGGEVEFSGFGVCDCSAGAAAFCGAALPKLVSKSRAAPGGVEGTDVSGVGFVRWLIDAGCARKHYFRCDLTLTMLSFYVNRAIFNVNCRICNVRTPIFAIAIM